MPKHLQLLDTQACDQLGIPSSEDDRYLYYEGQKAETDISSAEWGGGILQFAD